MWKKIRAILVAMAEEKPRIFQSGRDITYSLVAIVIVMALSVGFTGMCTFGKNTAEFAEVHKVDAATFFSLEARAMPFPVRLPEAPAEWITNSARRGAVDGQPAPVVGWVIAKTGYIQMTQTAAPLATVMDSYDAELRELTRTYQIEGHDVQVYTSEERGVRDVRVIDLGDARVLFEGAATDAEFDDIITRTLHTDPIPVTS